MGNGAAGRCEVERDVKIMTADGVELRTDVYHPSVAGAVPTLVQRTCYGRALMAEALGIPWFAERGYRVVFQDCRGSGDSTGDADFFAEAADGRATTDWIAEQDWFDGRLGAFGASYMGFTTWALASTRPPQLQALAVALMGSDRRAAWYPGGSFALDITLPWSQIRALGMEAVGEEAAAALRAAFDHLPLDEADSIAVGRPVPWYQDWLVHDRPDDPFWDGLNFTATLTALDVPILLVDGWYDYQLPHMVRDAALLEGSGVPHRLVIGPWAHAGVDETLNRETLAWFDHHLKHDGSAAEAPVRIFVMPDTGWRDLPGWPPAHDPGRWWLHERGGLARSMPEASQSSGFSYDPADPTPAFGGAAMLPDNAGPVDNRPLEGRDDVLVFTSEPLREPLEVVGPVAVELYLSASVEHFDVFARLCDVHRDGRSVNVSDAIRRVQPPDIDRAPDGTFPVTLQLWPTAYRFAARHRLRLQVAGGAHPLYVRNTCSGEPLGSASTIVVAHLAAHHDPTHPSALILPVAR